MLHSDSNKSQKELNQNINWKMFRITVDYLGGGAIQRQILKLTCSLIGVLCITSSTNGGFNVKGSSRYILKEFWPLLSFWCPPAGSKGKSHKLTSNFFRSILMQSQSHYLHQLYVFGSIVILFRETTIFTF